MEGGSGSKERGGRLAQVFILNGLRVSLEGWALAGMLMALQMWAYSELGVENHFFCSRGGTQRGAAHSDCSSVTAPFLNATP